MKVLFFAQSREAAGCESCDLHLASPLTQAELWNLLIEAYPALAIQRKTARLARNESYLLGTELLQSGDEIALLPPVSGG
jgi:molybdopterin converting factor subunit 1